MTGDPAALIYGRDAAHYLGQKLFEPERLLLARVGERWRETDMLDIGVGTGRTSYTFAPRCRTYVGVDYSEPMLEHARALVHEDETVSFVHLDARRLTTLGRTFDVALFSFNGIDSAPPDDRRLILDEVYRVLRPGGVFMMSSHSIHGLPLRSPLRDLRSEPRLRALRALPGMLRFAARVAMVNRSLDLPELERCGWAMIRDGSHGFDLRLYYVTANYQIDQLEAAGFRVVEIFGNDGSRVDPGSPGNDPWLHYLVEKPHGG